METQRQALYAKKGHGTQFNSEKERNQWLQKDIEALTDSSASESQSVENSWQSH